MSRTISCHQFMFVPQSQGTKAPKGSDNQHIHVSPNTSFLCQHAQDNKQTTLSSLGCPSFQEHLSLAFSLVKSMVPAPSNLSTHNNCSAQKVGNRKQARLTPRKHSASEMTIARHTFPEQSFPRKERLFPSAACLGHGSGFQKTLQCRSKSRWWLHGTIPNDHDPGAHGQVSGT